jgi:hypothetical protein
VADSPEPHRVLAGLSFSDVLVALGGAARAGDGYVANVLVTEALNRHRRMAAFYGAITVGAAVFIIVRTLLVAAFAADVGVSPLIAVAVTVLVLFIAAGIAFAAYATARRRLARLTV